MTVDTPGDPVKAETADSDKADLDARDIQVYFQEYDNLEYGLMYFHLNGYVVDAEELARVTMEGLKKEKRALTAWEYKITRVNEERVTISGVCVFSGRPGVIEGLVKTKGSKVWFILTFSQKNEAEAAARRIISSARLE